MPRTPEQQNLIDLALDPDVALVKCEACAGSGKTYSLLELTKTLNPTSGWYLAYNNAIAAEAEGKFKDTKIKCKTIHALAYSQVVNQYGLKPGYFGVRNVIPPTLHYGVRKKLVDMLDDFCLSAYVEPETYFDDNEITPFYRKLITEHLDKMSNGEIQCSHSFYLKLYHVLLKNGTIPAIDVDLLLLDEAGDITALTLDIFRLIKAKTKIAVGDVQQNIYGFNKTINAFTAMEHEGVSANLTSSFRVAAPIAKKVQKFVRLHLDPSFKFRGRVYDEPAEGVHAYISRNNYSLVENMFSLMSRDVKFNTTRKVTDILKLPLILANLDNGSAVKEYEFKDIERHRLAWLKSDALQRRHKTPQDYVKNRMKDDAEIQTGFKAVAEHGKEELKALAKFAVKCSTSKHDVMLTTAHSSKGLDFAKVTILGDLNSAAKKAIYTLQLENGKAIPKQKVLNEANTELRLYYVACTRAMTELNNATLLESL